MQSPVFLPPRPRLASWARSALLLALYWFSVSACERPDIVDPVRRNFVVPKETGPGLELLDARFKINGKLRSDRINLSTDQFVYLFVFVKSRGLYIVSADETDNALIAGRFDGSRLTFIVSNTTIEFENREGDVLDEGPNRSAWVEYFPSYDLLGPDARPDDAVVGLAASKSQIPGFLNQNE